MTTVDVSRYRPCDRAAWNEFVAASRNGTFLLGRDYLEYHADRFEDFSLMFRAGGRLKAVLPASIHGDEARSHGGLTYGGLIYGGKMNAGLALECFAALNDHLADCGVRRLLYKRVPAIYHGYPADEDLYALFRGRARLARRDLSVAIDLSNPLPFNERRRRNIKKAVQAGLRVEESRDFAGYFALLETVLADRHQVRPTHNAMEMAGLARAHPDNIRLFITRDDMDIQAGVLIYETPIVAHAQYLASGETGRLTGALDLVIRYLVHERYRDKKYFDFGVSTEDEGRALNEGLIGQKQEFGGRAVAHDFYELEIIHPAAKGIPYVANIRPKNGILYKKTEYLKRPSQ